MQVLKNVQVNVSLMQRSFHLIYILIAIEGTLGEFASYFSWSLFLSARNSTIFVKSQEIEMLITLWWTVS